jgi:mannosyltransferase OCH1-like enzyme
MIKNIYFFWYQGIKESPLIVKKCLESWVYYNPTWEIIILDKDSYSLYTNLQYDYSITLTKFSDFLRLSILKNHGGLWVDATCFCNKSLDEWLPSKCFLFENFNLNYEISTWFIYSEPEHFLITRWYDETNKIQRANPDTDYFFFFKVFDKLCQEEDFKQAWSRVQKINQNDHLMYFDINKNGNTHIKNNGFLEPLTKDIEEMIVEKKKFVFKLSYKYDYDITDDSILFFLFKTIDNAAIS